MVAEKPKLASSPGHRLGCCLLRLPACAAFLMPLGRGCKYVVSCMLQGWTQREGEKKSAVYGYSRRSGVRLLQLRGMRRKGGCKMHYRKREGELRAAKEEKKTETRAGERV